MSKVVGIELIGRSISDPLIHNLTGGKAAHASIEIDYTDGTKTVIESGPDSASGNWLVPQNYGDASKELFNIPIAVPGRSLDQLANQITNAYDNAESWQLPYDSNPFHYLTDSVDANSGSIISGLLNHVGVDLQSVEGQINAQGQALLLVGGFDTPYGPGFDGHSYYDVPEYIDAPAVNGIALAYDDSSIRTDTGFSTGSNMDDGGDIRSERDAAVWQNYATRVDLATSGALQLGEGIGGTLGGAATIAEAGFGPLSPAGSEAGYAADGIGALNEIAFGVRAGGITGAIDVAQGASSGGALIEGGSATAAGRSMNALSGDLGAFGSLFGGVQAGGVTGDLNAAQGLTRLSADFAPTGSAAAAGLASAASGIGAVAGLYEGFKTGGVVGGAEAGVGAATALELAGAATGIGLPIAAGVALLAAVFGGHRDNPANMPDKYDTARYGQEVADLHGTNGANGQNFVEDAHLKTVLGGRTGIAAIEETLAQYGSASNAPSWLAGMFGKLEDMFGTSSSGSGTLNFEHVIKNEWVSGAQGTDGKHYTYTDLAQALYDFANAEVRAGASPPAMSPLATASTGTASNAEASRADVHTLPVMRRIADDAKPDALNRQDLGHFFSRRFLQADLR